jgi:glycosyltransferase involved in cell wall biosynthesis
VPFLVPALRAARRLAAAERYDALVTVSHPFTSHLVGLALKRRFPALRWIADIGDPFSLLDETPVNNPRLYASLNRRSDRAVLRRADALSVTVESCRTAYTAAFPEIAAEKIAVIPPLLSLPEGSAALSPLTGKGPHLVFIGTLYRAVRSPARLLELFRALRARLPGLTLHFFGDLHDCADLVDPAEPGIAVHGRVPRETAAAAMRAADLLVNIGNATPHQLPSKLVEYVATGRPILNLASTPADSGTALLARYPAALTLVEADADRVLAFIDEHRAVDDATVRALVDEFSLPRIADSYERLVRGGADQTIQHVARRAVA